MPIKSLDPRISRANIPEKNEQDPIPDLTHWQTYEVFHQTKTGDRHIHVGSLHAPNHEMAFILAKEQFGRRYKTTSIWVAKTADIFTHDKDDEDIYSTTPEKGYREASGYKVMDKINKFKEEQKVK
jgi:ring-1,2-phenylacetyl-CoA epoxidase subunit PaaB